MSELQGTVKIYGTKLYSGCGHAAVKGFDSCPHCRIAELEEELRQEKLLSKEYRVKTKGLQRQNNVKGEYISELQAKLDRVRGLPEKWREHASMLPPSQQLCGHPLRDCADELESALGDEDE